MRAPARSASQERLWLHELAYTLRWIIVWPPERPEAELEPMHPVHRLRRLVATPIASTTIADGC